MTKKDTYKTLSKPSPEILFKEKKSKFIGYAFPITNKEEVKPIIDNLRKKHHTANHVCYAWQLGTSKIKYRANDDGEPNNSAGMPIYGQIQSFDVTNVLVAVVRIFGGTKLGVGGLIAAYRAGAQMALEESTIIEKIIKAHIEINFSYEAMDKVMRIIKQNQLQIVARRLELECNMTISIPKNKSQQIVDTLNVIKNIKAVEKRD